MLLPLALQQRPQLAAAHSGGGQSRRVRAAAAAQGPHAPPPAAARRKRQQQRQQLAPRRRSCGAAAAAPGDPSWTATVPHHPQQQQQQDGGSGGGGAAAAAAMSAAVMQAAARVAGAGGASGGAGAEAAAVFLRVGLGTATANGPHEKNEDAAVIARFLRAAPVPAAAAPSGAPAANGANGRNGAANGAPGLGPISVTSALSGAGLKNPVVSRSTVHAPLSAAATAVSVSRLDDTLSSCSHDGGDPAGLGLCGAGGALLVAHMAAVMDGHGGRGTAKWASRRLPHLVAEHMQRNPSGGLSAALVGALRAFDRWWGDAMHDPAISRHGHDDSGSTAALALVAPEPSPHHPQPRQPHSRQQQQQPGGGSGSAPPPGWRLAVANLGDSRALLVGPGGEVEELSELHNTGNPAELERLLAAGAQVVHPRPQAADEGSGGEGEGGGRPGSPSQGLADGHARFFPKGPIWGKRGLKVSRALGDVHFKRPAALVSSEPFTRELSLPASGGRRVLLLLSDGVTDVLTHDVIAAVALSALAPLPGGSNGDAGAGDAAAAAAAAALDHDAAAQAAAQAVVTAAATHELAHDNMTCVCVLLG